MRPFSGAASTVANPIVRFVLPDLELGTVMEDESVDADFDSKYTSCTVKRHQNQCKRFSHYKPIDQLRKRKTKNTKIKIQEYQFRSKDSIRKEVVSDHLY
jgi:hypothetical protein